MLTRNTLTTMKRAELKVHRPLNNVLLCEWRTNCTLFYGLFHAFQGRSLPVTYWSDVMKPHLLVQTILSRAVGSFPATASIKNIPNGWTADRLVEQQPPADEVPLEPERTKKMRCTLIGRGSALKPIAVNCGMGRERANTSAILAGQNGAAPQGDGSWLVFAL